MKNSPHNIEMYYYNNEDFIAYQQIKANSPFTIIFFGGFHSDMFGSKAEYLYNLAKEKNYNFIRFDYYGHGNSSGAFTDGTIGLWLDNCLQIIDHLTTGQLIIIGSSMGGWLMLLASLQRKERIAALIGLAAAPDFTEDLIWNALSAKEQQTLKTKGTIIPNLGDCHYTISYQLITESRNHLLLSNNINITCPIHLIHGMQDSDVPYPTSITLAEKLSSNQITIELIKSAGHRLSEPENLERIKLALENIIHVTSS